jgi:NAD(P)H-hydrate epimerase
MDKHRVKLNKTGNPGMTVGGTGDILAGLCAGFLAQSKNLFDSAYNAALINGKVGDSLFRKKGYGFTASDFISLIPEIIDKMI